MTATNAPYQTASDGAHLSVPEIRLYVVQDPRKATPSKKTYPSWKKDPFWLG
jgi:hypothetical protein